MRYVITGATSFIGIEICRYLLQHQEEVIAVCRPNSTGLSNLPSDVQIITAEMPDYNTLHKQIKKADVFINLAWEGTGHSGRNLTDIQKDNITNTLAAMESAQKMRCDLFVESGSQAEYGTVISTITENTPCNPFSEYGKAKLEVKNKGFELAEKLGIKYIHLRIFSIFGETDHPWTLVMSSIDKMLANEDINLSPCTQYWNFLYVKDAAKQIAKLCKYAVEKDGFIHEVFNVASKDTRILKDFVETMKRLTNSSSTLNYGCIIPQNLVSLKPDVNKTEQAIGFISNNKFENVINNIIKSKLDLQSKNKIYDKSF